MLTGEKMGQILTYYHILCCCLLLFLFDSPVSCDTLRKLGPPKDGSQTVTFVSHKFADVEKQELLKAAEDSLRVGRGIGFIDQFNTISTVISARSKKFEDIQGKNAAQRRLLAENSTRFDTREALGNVSRKKRRAASAKKEKRKVGQKDKKDQKGKRFRNSKPEEEKHGKDLDEGPEFVKQQLDQPKISPAPSSVDMGVQEDPNAAVPENKGGSRDTNEETQRIPKENLESKSSRTNVKEVEDENSESKSIQDIEKEVNDENSGPEPIQDIEKEVNDENSGPEPIQDNEKQVKNKSLGSKSIQENKKEVKDENLVSKSIKENEEDENSGSESIQENDKEVKDGNSVSKTIQDNVKEGNDETLELAEEITSPDQEEFSSQNNTEGEEGNSRRDRNKETPDPKPDLVELNQTISDRRGKWINGTGQELEIPKPRDSSANESTSNAINEVNESETLSIDKQPSSGNMEETTENSTAPAERMEDEYSDFIQEFQDLPSKFQDTAEKVADRLMPEFQKISNKSKIYFNRANEGITQGFRPLIGKQYAPFLASVVSYIFVLLPLVVVVVLFDQIRSYFPLQKVILYVNIYLTAYFATLMIASFLIGMEPMEFFYRNSLSGYIYLQLVEALGYLVYLFLQCLNLIICCSNGPLSAKFAAFLQCGVAIFIGLHYYVTVFHRAMAQKQPRTTWKNHGIYAFAFFVLCLFAKIKQGKKEYIQEGNGNNTYKKN